MGGGSALACIPGFKFSLFPCISVSNNKFRLNSSSSPITKQSNSSNNINLSADENRLIDALIGIQGRGRSASPLQLQEVESAIRVLEQDVNAIPHPTNSSLIQGRWRLMFTTRPGTASPIQTTFVGVDFFTVFQEVYLETAEPRVSNIVKFSDFVGELKVEAVASVEDGKRIIFQFDRAAFSFKFLPFKLPYPVPFRLLGDEAKGWLDTTYLSASGNIRISRGNKGTTFVLQKETEARQELLSAIATGSGVMEAIHKVMSRVEEKDEEAQLLEGEWKMIWSSQVETDSWLENAGNGLMGSQIFKGDGQIKFVVDILLGFKFSMSGSLQKIGKNKYDVKMDDGAIVFGSVGVPVNLETKFKLEILYGDQKMRITRGYNNILFVHLSLNQ